MNNESLFSIQSQHKIKTNQQFPILTIGGKHKQAFVVGLCGGSASGKTTVAQNIQSRIKAPWVVILSLDSFYVDLNEEQHQAAIRQEFDFDHPGNRSCLQKDSIDTKLARKTIQEMKNGKKNVIYGADVIIVEGILLFCYPEILELLDLKIFVETDPDLRLCRRVKRDMKERGRDLNFVITQYARFNYDKFIGPFEKLADIVIPWSTSSLDKDTHNYAAIDMIGKVIKRNLEGRTFNPRSEMIRNVQIDEDLLKKVNKIQETTLVKTLQTHIRCVRSSCSYMYSDHTVFRNASIRLMRLCLMKSLSLVPLKGNLVTEFERNVVILNNEICLVYIVRAGEPFNDAAKNVLYDYSEGRIFIQHNEFSGEPEVCNQLSQFHYLDLPDDIKDLQVLLCDGVIASGSSAMMAIRVLIDHDVPEENIILTTLIVTPTGVNSISKAFPNIKIVTSAIDEEIDKCYEIIPGCGNFGTRFYNSLT
ncbi:Uridine-cytidine kinase-like 1 [Thelohanellus kitauei]|uniref:uridine/cytidine kinase n=1 Tax=Thelohanellus kitauei TaxID=669202 RepID=A0A0C2J3P1_THEKT|nr:Uridine-cytidine kinase-like 1 [Thelohanellus kitauei]